MLAVKYDGVSLANVPVCMHDQEFSNVAVFTNPAAIKFVQDNFKTKELCKSAVQHNVEYIAYVPDAIKLSLYAELGLIELIEQHMITKQLSDLAFSRDPNTVRYIPDMYITQEMADIAIKHDSANLEYIPVDMRTYTMCLIAATHGVDNSLIPYEFRSDSKIIEAIESNTKCETFSHAVNLIKKCPHMIYILPQSFNDNLELLKIAAYKGVTSPLEKHLLNLPIMPIEEKIRIHPRMIKLVPCLSKELYEYAVSLDATVLEYVPAEYVTAELCKLAVSRNGHVLRYVPDAWKTIELVLIAVSNDAYALKYIPDEMKLEKWVYIAALTPRYPIFH